MKTVIITLALMAATIPARAWDSLQYDHGDEIAQQLADTVDNMFEAQAEAEAYETLQARIDRANEALQEHIDRIEQELEVAQETEKQEE